MIQPRILTAIQYLKLLQNLPNPDSYRPGSKNERCNDIIKIHLLNDNSEFISISYNYSTPNNYIGPGITVEFQIIRKYNIWFWQPVEEILIKPMSNET